MAMKTTTGVNVGIDVGKRFLDVYIHERDLHLQAPNTPEGIRKIIGRINRYSVERIVVEV